MDMKSSTVITEVQGWGCPLKLLCTKAQGNREVKVSMKYLRLINQAREKLRSEEGYALAVRRMIEPEPVFGDIKNNRGFKRFLLRGLPKVSLEVGWLSLAHNLLKKVVDAKNKELSVVMKNSLSQATSSPNPLQSLATPGFMGNRRTR